MVSAVMVVKEQRGCPELGASTVKDNLLKEQTTAGDDFALKVRKPYTITKQREKWTEEEHKKFLEALKLHGRAWRRIEEHVGTKTAVQIRSHAQKFFSKVVRESNTGEGNSVKPIEIPAPRPKRKPMHPYPRKLVSPVKTGILIPDKPARSASPNTLGQENQSPISVLSAVGSDSSSGADSRIPNGSPASVSSHDAVNIFVSEMPKLLSEDVISGRADREDENSSTDEEMPLEFDLSSAFVKGDSNESTTQSLKLFGTTLTVVDPHVQSCSALEACNPESFDNGDDICSLPLREVPQKFPVSTTEDVQSAFPDRLPILVYSIGTKSDILYTEITNEKLNPVDTCSPASFAWLTLRTNASYSTLEVISPTPIKAQSLYAKKGRLNNDEQKEGSSTGSNTDLVGGKNWDIDGCPLSVEQGKKQNSFLSYKLSKRISANSSKCRSGFVPYKRFLAEQDCTISLTGTAEEREKQRIRLSL